MRVCAGCGKVITGRGKKFCSELCRFKFGYEDRHKSRKKEGKTFAKKDQLCWSCDKACNGGCSWSARLEPVKGWDAEPIKVKQENGRYIDSFRIKECPLYKKEVRGAWLEYRL